MQYKNILVLTDFSKASDESLIDAVNFMKKNESQMTILHVIQDESNLSFVLSDSEYRNVENKLEKHARDMFDALKVRISGLRKLNYKTKIRKGIPYIGCLYEIENGDYDLIFLSSHGRSNLKHIFTGSTAEKVIRRSPISLFVTRRND